MLHQTASTERNMTVGLIALGERVQKAVAACAHRRAGRRFCGWFAIALMWFIAAPSRATGQTVSELPRADYYVGLEAFGAGRTAEAADLFQSALQGARRIGTQRWIDSIPPLVMLAECAYEQGNIALALENYDAALTLALSNPLWIQQIDNPAQPLQDLGREGLRKSIDWFPASRQFRPVVVPEGLQITIDPTQLQGAQPGVIVGVPTLVTRLDVTEVMRTMALALHRRWQLLGPLATKSPLSVPLARMFSRMPTSQVQWIQSSWLVLQGLSALSTPTAADAPNKLRAGMQVAGGSDYFLTPRVMLALAEIEMRRGAIAPAIAQYQDACLLAGYYEQHLELAEGLAGLSVAAAAAQRVDLLGGMQRAAAWASKRSFLAHVRANLGAMELALASNNRAVFERTGPLTSQLLRGREQVLPRYVADLALVQARGALARGDGLTARDLLDTALNLMRGSAETGAAVPRVFQIQLTLNLYVEGKLTMADAESVLDQLLADPSDDDWRRATLEMLATITTPSMPAYRHWLEMAVAQGDVNKELVRMDRMQRQRLFEALYLGGRMLAWRFLLATPIDQLPVELRPVAQAARQQYADLDGKLNELTQEMARLLAGPLPLDDREVAVDLRRSFASLINISQALEDIVLSLAISALPLSREVPPGVIAPDQVAQQLPDGHLVLAFADAGEQGVGLAISAGGIESWQISQMQEIRSQLQLLMNEIGLVRRQRPLLPADVLAPDAQWYQTIDELRKMLIPDAIADKLVAAQHVAIVPSGQLWYVPWELMPEPGQGGGAAAPRLIAGRSVTYWPTLGMALRPPAGHTRPKMAIGIAGRTLSLNRDLRMALAQQIAAAVTTTALIDPQQKAQYASPLWLRLRTDVLWSTALLDTTAQPLEINFIPPVQQSSDPLRRWLEFPIRGPQIVALTGANSGMVGEQLGDGSELFLPAAAMLLSGTRGAVLTRWPGGGRSGAELLSRYLSEVGSTRLAEAWRRSVLSLWASEFLVAEEPALLPAGPEELTRVSGQHPLLWSGYLHIGDSPLSN